MRAGSRATKKELTRKLNVVNKCSDDTLSIALVVAYDGLSDRQRQGYAMWQRAQISNGMALPIAEDLTVWFSASEATRAYQVTRTARNRRGTMVLEYRCQCPDFIKQGRSDCKHIFAEKLRRGEIRITGGPRKERASIEKASRRPARKRFASDGRPIRSVQRRARRKMPRRIPELVISLGEALKATSRGILIPIRSQSYRGGRNGTPLWARAIALISKIARGCSADEMMHEYERMIEGGTLPMSSAPDPNTLSNWMNDERLTPILEEFLRLTTLPFREREVGAIIDSSKVSQMMTAHSRHVEYGNDERYGADWAKCHALVGVETLVVMAVSFSGTRNAGTHDINFLKPLVEQAQRVFPLEFLLGDKAYLKGKLLEWLWERHIKAAIPLKKGWFREADAFYHEAIMHLVEWYDRNNNRDFHEIYRLRPKIEALFSLLKRLADNYCWSRGRNRKEVNADLICTAWKNELLCKFIYVNLRTTVHLEEETGYVMDYLIPERRFPRPTEPLLKHAA